ncbi:hypothetical protein NKH52_23225 [Mesorhizobium sp. M1066]|uniref:hypothetical protein n=1 Tax=unclassified Mesorhizobium TaxID=325217 RepID=UPI00333636F1
MAQRQLQRRQDYEQTETTTVLQATATAIASGDPDDIISFETARQDGLDLISKRGLDPQIRQQVVKDWFGTAAKTRFEALIAKDPKRALEMFGVGTPASGGEATGDRLGKKTPDETVARAFEGRAPAPDPIATKPAADSLADLSPNDVQRLIDQAHAATTAQLIEARTNIALASQNAPDAIANTGSYSGKMPSPADFAAVYGAEEGGKQYQNFSLKMDVGRQAFGMRTMPNQAIHAALRDAEPAAGSSEDEQTRYQVTAAAALKTLGMRRADPAGYVRDVFANVDAAWRAATSPDSKSETSNPAAYRWAIAISVAAQRQLGVETPQPLPRAVVQSLADTFSDEDVPQAEKDIILHDLLAAAPDPGVRQALSRQLDQARPPQPAQVDSIITSATGQGRVPSAQPGQPRSAFQQAADDFGDYLSEGFEALGRVPHDIGIALQDLYDDPLDAVSQLPVTSASGATAGGVAGLRWLGANFLKDGKIATELIEPALRVFSKRCQKTFFKEYPELVGLVFVHHRIEQKVLERYVGIMSEEMMHSLENLRGIPRELNSTLHLSTIRREWDAFYRQNPTTTLQKLLEKAAEIDQKYGHLFNPPIGKK